MKRHEINNLDFSRIKQKIQNVKDGESWTYEECELGEKEYKRFLTLLLLYPSKTFVPNEFIDTFWHYHILDTRKYLEDTVNIFGEFIHHYPYLGMNGEEDKRELEILFKETNKVYYSVFNEHMTTPISMEFSANCSRGCGARCMNIRA